MAEGESEIVAGFLMEYSAMRFALYYMGEYAHIAIASVHGMDFLMTWNCRHIANAAIVEKLRAVCEREGFPAPVICTPYELMV